MKDFLATGAGIVIVIALLAISPMVLLWSLNTIFEQASVGIYIPHDLRSYVASFGVIGCLRGGK